MVTVKFVALSFTLAILAFCLCPSCVGDAIVQGDEAPVGEVAQGVKVHGLPVRHGEKQEEKVKSSRK